jgi:hypothetical protein
MDFFSYLDEVRQRPEYVRKGIALWVSGGITGMIFLLWLSFVTLTPITQQQVAQTQSAGTETSSPLTRIQAGFESIIEQFR